MLIWREQLNGVVSFFNCLHHRKNGKNKIQGPLFHDQFDITGV